VVLKEHSVLLIDHSTELRDIKKYC